VRLQVLAVVNFNIAVCWDVISLGPVSTQ